MTSETIRILIIDDDPTVRKSLRHCFEGAGYAVCEAATVDEARRKLAERTYNLATVDVFLEAADGSGSDDGQALAGEIRAQYDCGIIMVSIVTDQGQHNHWLEDWADDTITKPFDLDVLLARTRAVLRRYGVVARDSAARGGEIATFAGWTLDLRRLELWSPAGLQVSLTMGDFHLLRTLIKHPREVLSRDRIVQMDASFQSMSSSDSARAVDMRISRLRDKLEDNGGGDKRLIRTVRGAGYMFMADVDWLSSPQGGSGAADRPAPEAGASLQ